MKVSLTNYENILIYFQNTTLHYKLLFNLLYKTQANEWPHGYQFLVQLACSVPPLLYFILVPLTLHVSGHKMTKTSATLELKQKRLLWAVLTNDKHNISFAIAFKFAHESLIYHNITEMFIKVAKSIGLQHKLNRFLPKTILKTLCTSLIHPYLLYGTEAWHGTYQNIPLKSTFSRIKPYLQLKKSSLQWTYQRILRM